MIFEERKAILAAALGVIHRRIRFLLKLHCRASMLRIHTDADTGCDKQLVLVYLEWLLQLRCYPASAHLGFCPSCRLLKNHGKLITSDSCKQRRLLCTVA